MQTEKTYPLSPQQAHLCALQSGDGSGPFRVQFLLSITGPLDKTRLSQAISEIVSRYEILRTSSVTSGSEALQLVRASDEFALSEQSLRGIPDCEREGKIATLWSSSLQLAFSPNESLRVTLLAPSAEKNFILVSLSAFCADLKTGEILARQIGQAYAARQDGKSLSGNAVVQYGDLASWQNELLEVEDLRAGREYWSGLGLENMSVPRLPFRGETSLHPGFTVQEFTACVPRDLMLRVRQTAENYGVSVASFLLASWFVLLGRSSGAPKIPVWVACDGRKYDELKEVVGPFTKFLPVIAPLEEGSSFVNLLTQMDQAVAANHKWQECFSRQ